MPKIAVRRAIESDLARCEDLIEKASVEMEEMRGGSQFATHGSRGLEHTPDSKTLVQEWISLDHGHLLVVGEANSLVVGVAAGTIYPSPKPLGRIEICYVERSGRGAGVGAALIRSLVEWFDQAGCIDIDATALPGDRATKQLLEQAGFKARLLVMHRSLGLSTSAFEQAIDAEGVEGS